MRLSSIHFFDNTGQDPRIIIMNAKNATETMPNNANLKRGVIEKEAGTKQPTSCKRSRSNDLPTAGGILTHITLSPKSSKGCWIDREDFLRTFQRYQIAYIPNARSMITADNDYKIPKTALQVSDIPHVFQAAADEDRETWTQETAVAFADKNKDVDEMIQVPGEFLKEQSKDKRGYCSFILQHDKAQHEKMLRRLPFADLPLSSTVTRSDAAVGHPEPLQVTYGPGLWIFFGRNSHGTDALQGRVEHTDSIQHDGTWHYQLWGSKEWHVRPTAELLDSLLTASKDDDNRNGILFTWKEEQDLGEKNSNTAMTIRCQEGDILVLNTHSCATTATP